MAEEKPKPAGSNEYAERAKARQAAVEKLEATYKQKPSPELKDEIKRRRDTMLHLMNMAKGETGERARSAAEKARSIVLNRAVQQ